MGKHSFPTSFGPPICVFCLRIDHGIFIFSVYHIALFAAEPLAEVFWPYLTFDQGVLDAIPAWAMWVSGWFEEEGYLEVS